MSPSKLSESDFDSLVNVCMARVGVKKTDWSIPDSSIAVVTPLLTDWNTKYAITKNKKLASAADREAKDLARKALSPEFSKFIEINIYLNSNMNAADIKSCNLEPRKTTKTKTGKPATIPQMEYKQSKSHSLKAYYHQEPGEDGVSKRGKPKGVGSCEIAYVLIDIKPDNPNGNPAQWNPDDFVKRVVGTRTPMTLEFTPADAGRYVILVARWISTNFINGDWGLMEVMMIP